jgi:hypothetical protein
VPESLGRCDLVMRVDWIRDFRPFTLVESFGYLWRKLVVVDKYHDRQVSGESQTAKRIIYSVLEITSQIVSGKDVDEVFTYLQ